MYPYDEQKQIIESKDLSKFREYLKKGGLMDTIIPMLFTRQYVEAAKIFFGEFGYTGSHGQQVELVQKAGPDIVMIVCTKSRLCKEAQDALAKTDETAIVAAYEETFGFTSPEAVKYIANNLQVPAVITKHFAGYKADGLEHEPTQLSSEGEMNLALTQDKKAIKAYESMWGFKYPDAIDYVAKNELL